MIVASLIMALVNMKHVPFEVSWSLGWIPRALTTVFGSMLLTAAGMFLVTRWLPATRFGKPLILQTQITAKASDGESLVGRHGIAETMLRPAGKITIGGKRIDVVTDGGFLEAGERVVVVQVDGPRVVVRRA
jgi:membrane-bound serine protease (ClpP class)